MIGKVYLVGAGPGDPDLITLKAIELIKKGGGTINCFCTLIELEFLSGRSKIQIPYETLIKY